MFSYASVSTLYVSLETGKTNNTGVNFVNDMTMNGPVPTINDALKIVSEMRRTGYLQPVTIKLMDKEYPVKAPIGIGTAPDCYIGSANVRDITFESFGPEKTVISGGKRLSGFKNDTFNGHECWSLYIPEVKEGKWKFKDLYVNGYSAPRTRYPDSGYIYPEAVEIDTRAAHVGSTWFIAKEGDINPNAKNLQDAVITFCHYWIDEHTAIKSYDPVTRKCEFAAKSMMRITAKQDHEATMEYYIENLAEAFKNPGEWYLDAPEGMLYYMPKNGETFENTEIIAPITDRLIDVKGNAAKGNRLERIYFRNIAFAYTKSDFQAYKTEKDAEGKLVKVPCASGMQCQCDMQGIINFTDCHDCAIDNCEVYCCGTYGIKVLEGCDHIRISNTTVRDCAGGGVSVGGGLSTDPEYTWTHDITVTNCTLKNLGQRHFSGAGVLLMHAYNCEVSHNDIHDLFYTGVSSGWIWGYADTITRNNHIYKNHIYNLGKGILSDMGGVYLLGAQPGTVVEGNLIHDIKSRYYGGWALYTDEGSAYIVLRNNICYNVSANCYHQHYGVLNQVRNNIFAYAGNEAIRITRVEAQECLLIENNIILCTPGKAVYGNCTPMSISTDRNIIWNADGKEPMFTEVEGYSEALEKAKEDPTMEWMMLDKLRVRVPIYKKQIDSDFGWDRHSLIKNPRFKDAKNFDFTLRKDSPAFELGFEAIDMSDVGRQ